jgi:hypothetical protein
MKTVRLRTKAGEVRFTSLADLPSWWHETKFLGGAIGNNWCLPFDEIAVADLADVIQKALMRMLFMVPTGEDADQVAPEEYTIAADFPTMEKCVEKGEK